MLVLKILKTSKIHIHLTSTLSWIFSIGNMEKISLAGKVFYPLFFFHYECFLYCERIDYSVKFPLL